ncbi:hypothetical protein ACLHWS_11350 [Flavobacterium psychrophilum]|uniref:hypothetical protein n=1 Tax=Flavobacterium psychrophilum TaxID=96345 RepID=UPI003985694F
MLGPIVFTSGLWHVVQVPFPSKISLPKSEGDFTSVVVVSVFSSVFPKDSSDSFLQEKARVAML